mmetsp:Transcript_42992/g.134891  ORF Transcript_42992/g.134891 Transcript_42992/m.134891 type:complete len:221 (-) Transcript_42992:53-715(-)
MSSFTGTSMRKSEVSAAGTGAAGAPLNVGTSVYARTDGAAMAAAGTRWRLKADLGSRISSLRGSLFTAAMASEAATLAAVAPVFLAVADAGERRLRGLEACGAFCSAAAAAAVTAAHLASAAAALASAASTRRTRVSTVLQRRSMESVMVSQRERSVMIWPRSAATSTESTKSPFLRISLSSAGWPRLKSGWRNSQTLLTSPARPRRCRPCLSVFTLRKP